jgi:hypothetical protein
MITHELFSINEVKNKMKCYVVSTNVFPQPSIINAKLMLDLFYYKSRITKLFIFFVHNVTMNVNVLESFILV